VKFLAKAIKIVERAKKRELSTTTPGFVMLSFQQPILFRAVVLFSVGRIRL